MNLTQFKTRKDASVHVAQLIEQAITTELLDHNNCTISLSGGSTPKQCYQILSRAELAWSKVNITLTDERCVPIEHEDSNTRMFNEQLVQNNAVCARIIPIEDISSERHFAAVLLGMGEDGHFASIFPDSPEKNLALDITQPPGSLKVHTEASEHQRITMNLAALNQTEHLLMLIFGDAKLELIKQLDSGNNNPNLPVISLLKQKHPSLSIFWAP